MSMSKTTTLAHPAIVLRRFLMPRGIEVIPVPGIPHIRFRRECGGNLPRLGDIRGDGFMAASLHTT